ncbi:pyridoxamine 5'-phosphate oxidase-domain-containing protein, partial [Sphaerosporella brunnea]
PIDLSTASIPTVAEAAKQARRLVLSEPVGTLSTVFPEGNTHGLAGLPIGLMDYHADCSATGDPTLLGMGIATSFRNALPTNSSISLSVREHAPRMFSPVAHPRVSLIGKLVKIPDEDETEKERVKRCFVKRHPDAMRWTPGNKIHDSFWVRFEVEKVYWVGGFGNVAYIGWIPIELYHGVEPGEAD